MTDVTLLSEEIDLTNCNREPIHIPGQVQTFGCLLAFSADWHVTHASMNCAEILGQKAETLIGGQVSAVISQQAGHDLRSRMQTLQFPDSTVRLFSYPLFNDDRRFDLALHRSGTETILEIEPRQDPHRATPDQADVQALISRLQGKDSIISMAQEAARGLKVLSGFDRVMVYRFEEDDSGTVIAESHAPGMNPFLGLRYPASDIPKQARALYVRSPLRLISDVDGPTHAIIPARNPMGDPLDLSLAVTRAVSPIHLEYMRNMGVVASMSVSIIRKGKLWGLFVCHHRAARYITYEERSLIELFAQLFNYELARQEMEEEFSDLDRGRLLHDRLMAHLSDGQNIFDIFDMFAEQLKDVIPFDGAAIYSDGIYKAIGSATTEEEFVGLARFLNTAPTSAIYATDHLSARYPDAAAFIDRVGGILALPISRTPRDYLVLFRHEIAKSVNWAGSPEKPVELGPNGARLTPRKSFEAWQQIVRGQCTPWRKRELRAAEAMRVTLLEVVLKLADENNAARKRAQDQQELLIAELNHRVRNILTLIRGLVSQSAEEAASVADYGKVLDARIHALARAHDQLTQSEWDWVSFTTLVETEVQAYLTGKADRVRIAGDPIALTPTAFTTMALVIHELVTNAAKYGALCDSNGTVSIQTSLNPDGTATIQWREHNGPPVQAPKRQGFGATIIERSVPFELSGRADLRFRMGGVEADFSLPSQHVRLADSTHASAMAPPTPKSSAANTLSGHALVVEDNMLIALDASDMMTQLGASAVSTAGRVTDALDVITRGKVDFALIDVNLGTETSFPVIEKCVSDEIPLVLATGYGATEELTNRFPEVPILRKPYTIENIRALLTRHGL